MYDCSGKKTWEAEYDMYGKVRKLAKGSLTDCPFRYQGQYEDVETGLYYNRFRYYASDEGVYLSQDPIRLAGSNPNLYAYTHDVNSSVDVFGLSECEIPKGKKINRKVYRYSSLDHITTTWDAHKWNKQSSHRYTKNRYTKKVTSGVYGANSPKTALAEITHWDVNPDDVVLASKGVKLDNVLDLTDSSIRKQLNVDISDITGNDYNVTHKIGDWAIENGYDGILAPSARNMTGSNLIGFGGL